MFRNAEKYLELALNQNPENSDYIIDYSEILAIMGKYNKSISVLENLLRQLIIENLIIKGVIFNNLGNLWQMKRDYDKALQYYKKVLVIRLSLLSEFHPEIMELYNNIGIIWELKENFIKARESFEKAISISKKINFDDDNLVIQKIKLNLEKLRIKEKQNE